MQSNNGTMRSTMDGEEVFVRSDSIVRGKDISTFQFVIAATKHEKSIRVRFLNRRMIDHCVNWARMSC